MEIFNSKKQYSDFPLTVVVLITLICLVSLASYQLSFFNRPYHPLAAEDGSVDLRELDLAVNTALLPHELMFYPEILLEPGQLQTDPGIQGSFFSQTDNAGHIPYGSYRTVLHAQPDTAYMMYGFTLDYGTKLFCNGTEIIEVGTVADNAETAVPRISEAVVPLWSDENGDIELIIQYSNFVHKNGGSMMNWRIGLPAAVMQVRQQWTLITAITGGGFFAFSLYLCYSSILNRSKLYYYMSLLCIIFILRDQNFYYGFFLRSDYNWYLCYKLNLAATMTEPFLLFYVFSFMMQELRIKYMRHLAGAVFLVLICLLAAMNTMVSSTICNTGVVIGLVFDSIIFVRYIDSLMHKAWTGYDFATLVGCIVTMLCGLAETVLYHRSEFFTRSGIMSYATIILIFIIKAIVDSRRAQAEKEYNSQKILADALETQRKMRQEFLANVSHEMRTPLTVISGYAQRVQLRLSRVPEIPRREEINANLETIASEAQRLGTLVNQLLESSAARPAAELTGIDLNDMRQEIRNLCSPILEKNLNRLEISFSELLPKIRGDRQLISQILVNLTVNANRHCKGDTLVLRAAAAENPGMVCLELEDHGDGMSRETLEKAMLSGFSGDGGTGLGLSICAETMRSMEGTMGISSEQGKGTTVRLLFRTWEGDRNERNLREGWLKTD